MAKVKSMRGEEVDVSLIKMKHQLMSGKKTETAIKREDFVSDRRRRSSSKRVSELLASEQAVRQKLEEQKKTAEASPDAQVVLDEVTSVQEDAVDDFIEHDVEKTVEADKPKTGRVIKKS